MTPLSEQPNRNSTLGFLARLLLPLIILGAALFAFGSILTVVDPGEPGTLLSRSAAGVLLSLFAILLATSRFAESAGGPNQSLGRIRFHGAGRGLGLGVALWLTPAAVVFIVLGMFGSPLQFVGSVAEILLVGALVALAVLLSEALPEELVFRGQLMNVLSEKFTGWWIILIQAGLFTLFALALRGWTGFADLSLFVGMGIGLGYIRVITGSVWVAIGFHAAFQTGSQLLLTHEVASFDGSQTLNMMALGAVPFAFAAIFVALCAPKYPRLFTATKRP
ncbi:CPBP family intramembrane glutamic endopeptidase [Glutamicibacter uratoxydans]|uniref:CPBP family intramembrane glutamic endopeptidase n=1 Tax=Glutamicibacter uratoxydans TaxID=43667 RepID=UPI003D6DDECE